MGNKIIRAHKIRLNPTPQQAEYFEKAARVARDTWNWALGEYNWRSEANREVKEVGKGYLLRTGGRDSLKKYFNKFVKPKWEMANEVTYHATAQPFIDLDAAIKRYFEFKKRGELKPPLGWKSSDGKPFGWPNFKSWRRTTPSFYITGRDFEFDGYEMKFENRVGWINMTEQLRFSGKLKGGRITKQASHWYLAIQVEMPHQTQEHNQEAIGVDLGIKYLAETSDDREPYQNPRAYYKAQRKLRRLQRKLDRQRRVNNPDNYNENGTIKKGRREWHDSNRMKKTQLKIAKLHARIKDIRNEEAHKLTTQLTDEYGIIGLEDLNVRGMLKNKKLAKAISDAAFFEKRRQFTYKAEAKGGVVVVIDTWFPSSKLCSGCKEYKKTDLKLSDRQWICPECGQVNERDANAAINIRDEALRILYSSPEYLHGDVKRSNANT